MAQIIAVAQQKGGAGKTMLAAQLAVAFAADWRVAAVDIDPQQSLTAWGRLRAANPKATAAVTCATLSGWRLAAEIERLAGSHDLVLIDTPPVIDSDARRAIRSARLVLIPLNPAPPDLWAAEGTLKLAAEEKRTAALVFNRAPAGGRLRRRLEAEIAARRLTLLDTALGNRAAFATSFADGLGITEAAAASPGAAELHALVTALRARLSMVA
jgi:chromosome partitioning protein